MRYGKFIDEIASGYDYLFYRIYVWQKSQWKDEAIARNSAGVNVGLLIGMNLITLSNAVASITKSPILSFFQSSNFTVAVATVCWIWSINIIYRKRANKIIADFEKEHESERSKKTVYVWGYGVGTAFLFLVSIVVTAFVFQGT